VADTAFNTIPSEVEHMTDEGPYSLTVPAAPEAATTLRVFVAECARRWDASEEQIDDLRLLVTELLGNSIDRGEANLRISLVPDGPGWALRAEGAGRLKEAEGADDAGIDRRALIGALASVVEGDGWVELRTLANNAPQT
jgi:hypothetical protein